MTPGEDRPPMTVQSLFRRRGFRHFVLSAVLTLIVVTFLSYRFGPVRHISLEGEGNTSVYIEWVIDGDTVVARGGEKIRYAGIDTPEKGEPYYEEAKKRNMELVLKRTVRLEICRENPRDPYGRLLAWLYVDGLSVEETLLREGLARVMTIPPCGLVKAERYRDIEKRAKASGIGIWGR